MPRYLTLITILYIIGSLSSAALALPGRDAINIGLAGVSLASLATFCITGDPTVAALALASGVVSSGALGLHMTSSIGGADMPVSTAVCIVLLAHICCVIY